jgi:DNA-binding transcriptional ArsR family regulator
MTKYQPIGAEDTVGVVAGVLASPRRRAIVSRLCRGPATTSELAAETGATLPTMQQHLERLRHAGLITSTKAGRTVTHTVDVAPLTELEEWIAARRTFWNAQLTSLANAVEGPGAR